MKRIFNILFVFSTLLFVMSGCEKEVTTEDVSQITYYVTFELEGESLMNLPVGEPYVEPGFSAMEGDNDVTGTVDVSGSVDENSLGLYEITYSAVNSDGFSSSVTRTVIVYDPTAPDTDLTGTYTANISRRPPYTASFKGLTVELTKVAPGIFEVSDFLGGYYDQGAGYGIAYRMFGYMSLNADNTFTLLSSYVAGWGDQADKMEDGKYDPDTGQVSWTIYYAGFLVFDIVLNK